MRVVWDSHSAASADKLHTNLFLLLTTKLSLLMLPLLQTALHKLRTTHGTSNTGLLLEPMPCPYNQAFYVEVVAAFNFTIAQTHGFFHSVLTDRTHRFACQCQRLY